MREPPPGLTDDEVLSTLRRAWGVDADEVEHLPVGFGAHHWRASTRGEPRLFLTLDELGTRHTAESLERAYAAAAEVELDFVVAPLAARTGSYTVPLRGMRLSCTPWTPGEVAGAGPITDDRLARANIDALAALHTTGPPAALVHWQPRVGPAVAAELERAVRPAWATGPYGEPARAAIAARMDAIARWADRYHRLVERACGLRWVPTHGEPHTRNQLLTPAGPRFVDWESFALAPRERDLGPLIDAGYADHVRPDWSMVEMYDLEWRLDEIAQYAAWFARPHADTEDDRIAFGGLRHELDRPEWRRP